MVWYFPSSCDFSSEDVSLVLESAEKPAFDILSKNGGWERCWAEAEGNEEENFLIMLDFFLHFLPSSSFCRIFLFSLWWWYGKLRGRLWLLWEFFILHIIFVSFSPSAKKKAGVGEEWQWHFRQLKHFFFPFVAFIARMNFMKKIPPFWAFFFSFHLETILPSFYAFIIQSGGRKKSDEGNTEKATQRKC